MKPKWMAFLVIAAGALAANIVFAKGIKSYQVEDPPSNKYLIIANKSDEVMRFNFDSRTIWVNPEWDADEAARVVLDAMSIRYAMTPCDHVEPTSKAYIRWRWKQELSK